MELHIKVNFPDARKLELENIFLESDLLSPSTTIEILRVMQKIITALAKGRKHCEIDFMLYEQGRKYLRSKGYKIEPCSSFQIQQGTYFIISW